ncbi:magnesium transporter MgtE N-terminal domain-containing protein [Sulfurimonas sp.]|uniref:magnesium transporter MgtE N-terminal domain-containing protein n=1 Tax=Sulfurimonas sp. TaxID=2022749 RepID=UPI003564851C
MRLLVVFLVIVSHVFAIETSEKLFECSEIFKARKSELLIELERIDEQKQALEALKNATEDLLKDKKRKVDYEAEVVEAKRQEITEKEANIKKMLDENKAILEKLTSIKMDKVAQTFAKMKAASAASILSDMEVQDAADILSSLKPKTVGKILSKMDPKKGSELTLLLAK